MMNSALIAFTPPLADYALLLTLQLALILIVRRPILKVFGAVHAYRIWLLPVIWAPLCFIDSSWSQAEVVQTWVSDTIIQAPVAISPSQMPLPESLPGPVSTGPDRSADVLGRVREVNWQGSLAGLWLTGLLSLLIRQCRAIRRFAGYVDKHAVAVGERERQAVATDAASGFRVPLYTLAGLGSPVLFGAFKPVLLLPADFLSAYDSDQRRLILSHEAVHLRRRDNLWNLCAWGLKTLFWFNPLVHMAYRRYRADQELSCDAQALSRSSTAQRRRYVKTLLESFGGNSGIYHTSPLLTAWSSLNTIKERIGMIKQYPQSSSHPLLLRASVLSIVLAGAGVTALMTGTLTPQSFAADAPQREAALLQLADSYIAAGGNAANYKRALALYQELADMSEKSNGDYLFRIATTYARLKQPDKALAAVREAIEAYGEDAPLSAYRMLLHRTRDLESKRQIHEMMVERFNDPQDAARLSLYLREDGTYDPQVLGPGPIGFVTTRASGSPSTVSEIRVLSPTPFATAIVTPDDIRFAPSPQPLEFVKPEYPEELRLGGREGWHVVVFDLDENGGVVNPVVLDTNSEELLVDTTLAALSQFRFDPSQHEPISEVVDMAYLFLYELPRLD